MCHASALIHTEKLTHARNVTRREKNQLSALSYPRAGKLDISFKETESQNIFIVLYLLVLH